MKLLLLIKAVCTWLNLLFHITRETRFLSAFSKHSLVNFFRDYFAIYLIMVGKYF